MTNPTVDLTNCEREPIQFLGHVQSFGCLVAVSSDWIVMHASRNVQEHLGCDPEAIIGLPIREILAESAIHDIRSRLQVLNGEDSVERMFRVKLLENDERLFNVAIHVSGRSIVLDLEPVDPSLEHKDYLSHIRPMVERIKTCRSVEDVCASATRYLKALTGFDRVMVYRFRPDDTGDVIAEAAGPNVESFKGLRYPASDIPPQARQLYRRSLLRIISDVDDNVSEIIPAHNSDGAPLDLSLSGLRAVSPIHLEYLRNMGVKASMSISILQRGKLWGLFACHHYQPRVLSFDIRTACDLFGQMFSFVLEQIETNRAHDDAEQARGLHDRLMAQLAEGADIEHEFETIVRGLSSSIRFDGAVGWINKRFQSVGNTPTEEEFLSIARFLNTASTSRVYATDCLQKVHPPAADHIQRGAGLMALPVSRTPRDYIVLFRQEVSRSVTWAGNPEKPVEPGPNGLRLTPRKSFEAWREAVHGHSAEWTPGELQVAEAIRVTLLEVVLRMSDAASRDRLRAHERQELLIAELNHRVRNILNLIRGLVSQSRSNAGSVAEFTETVSGRVHALARAHDQITQKSWAAASLSELIEVEVEAYLAEKFKRVKVVGTDAALKPEALTTLALVVHELTTNSAKYGALSDRSGDILITLEREKDGDLSIAWEERNGPPVKAPMRRGFGSTVIERSIPFDLGGKAEVEYVLSGLKARFLVPSRHVENFTPRGSDDAEAAASEAHVAGGGETSLEGRALVVEDNMIIAMDAEQHLLDLGVKEVHVAGSVAEALRLIDGHAFDFALLDVNLGSETSLPIAERLTERGMPFVFATGYGEVSSLVSGFPHSAVVTKPFSASSLRTAILQVMKAGKA